MKKDTYCIVNILVAIVALSFLVPVGKELHSGLCQMDSVKLVFITAGAACTAFTLFIKMVRFYFIILEKRPGASDFVRLHMKTTLVSLLLPFKSGEFFRMYCFGARLGNYRTGCLLVLVDRYFDTVPLLILLAGTTVLGGIRASAAVWPLGLFVVLMTVAYLSFPSTYRYLNRFLIVNTSSPRGLAALQWLGRLRDWHSYIRELIAGREMVLVLLSGVAWGLEYAGLWCLYKGLGHPFSSGELAAYISSILTGGGNFPGKLYIGISCFWLSLAAAAAYGIKLAGRGGQA